jgi:hypothetical protein
MLQIKTDSFLILGGENIKGGYSELDFEAFEFNLKEKDIRKAEIRQN